MLPTRAGVIYLVGSKKDKAVPEGEQRMNALNVLVRYGNEVKLKYRSICSSWCLIILLFVLHYLTSVIRPECLDEM